MDKICKKSTGNSGKCQCGALGQSGLPSSLVLHHADLTVVLDHGALASGWELCPWANAP